MSSLIPRIYEVLLKEYGKQGWWPIRGAYFPDKIDPFEIIAGAVLTQNTSWMNASRALEALRGEGLLTPKRILGMEQDALAAVIRSSGYYNQKARRLMGICRYLIQLPNEGIPRREELLAIHGIGPETADSILLYAYGVPLFVIDAYTRRMFVRVGIAREQHSYEELEELITSSIPRSATIFGEYHALIVRHCRERCRKNPLCTSCRLNRERFCSYEPVNP
jgi:endonuclease-3 related protein